MKLKVLFGKSYYLRNFIKKLEEKRTLTKIKKLSDKQKDLLLIKAITEFGDLAIYKVVNGSHGLTLHAYADSPKDATLLRRMNIEVEKLSWKTSTRKTPVKISSPENYLQYKVLWIELPV